MARQDIRALILRELKRQKRSRTWLSEQVKHTSRNSVFRYLRGEGDITASGAAELIDIVGLKIVRKPKE